MKKRGTYKKYTCSTETTPYVRNCTCCGTKHLVVNRKPDTIHHLCTYTTSLQSLVGEWGWGVERFAQFVVTQGGLCLNKTHNLISDA